ncbi:MAG: hypothetical protein HUU02_08520, partial [Bacteroidetes bacterium]|nr:hypothetical protein [Bacteroidota bacterium]
MYRLPSGAMSGTIRRTVQMLVCIFMAALTAPFLMAQGSPHGPLKQQCTDCHTTASWKELAVPMRFNHTATGFPLKGSHANVTCLQCHTAKRFAGTSAECFTCHQDDYGNAVSPNHQTGLFPHECSSCHTMNSWRPSSFDHAKTNFALLGAHASVECSSCHTGDRFKGLSSNCFSCHQKDYAAVKTPDHAAAGFDRECTTCHTTMQWQPSTFDHNRTQYPLTGAHRTAECSSCHTNGTFKGIARDCYTCHQRDLASLKTPDHVKGQFSRDCLTCHTNTVWKPSTFDHAKSSYPLQGAHRAADCSSCHVNEQYKGLPNDCYTCHQKEFA